MSVRTMFDAVDITNLPTDVALTLGYVDGRETAGHYDRVRAARPHAKVVPVTVTGATLNAVVGDVETGDMNPASGAAWAHRKVAAAQHPTLYCNVSTWPSVRAEVQKIGLAGRVFYLIAHYDGIATIPAGAIGKQFTDHALGKSLDESVIAAHWPGVDPDPVRAPHLKLRSENRGYAWLVWSGTPGARQYDFYQDGVLIGVTETGQHITGPHRLHGRHVFRILAVGPGVHVWSNAVTVDFP